MPPPSLPNENVSMDVFVFCVLLVSFDVSVSWEEGSDEDSDEEEVLEVMTVVSEMRVRGHCEWDGSGC